MKITIISAYTWYNKGDAAILMGTLTEINEFFGQQDELKINILTFTPDIDSTKYKKLFENIEHVESNIFNPYPLKKTKVSKGLAILKMGLQYFNMKTQTTIFGEKLLKNKSYQICSESDLIIICGGGFLGGNKYNSLIHLAQMDIIQKLNKPTVLWGTSIEPPRKKILKSITEAVLKKVDIILPREEITHNYLKSWYPQDRIVPTPDMAFKLGVITSESIENLVNSIRKSTPNKKIIGITMREWFFPKSENPKEAKKKYENALVELINKTSKKYLFVFVPQVIMYGDDDRIFANIIKSKLDDENNLLVLEEDYSSYELKNMIELFDQFLGTRMHSNIFCSTVGKAPVAIAYEKKTNGIMDKLNLTDYVVDIEDVNYDILLNMLNSNKLNQIKLDSQTREKVNQFQNEIREATYLVEKKLKKVL